MHTIYFFKSLVLTTFALLFSKILHPVFVANSTIKLNISNTKATTVDDVPNSQHKIKKGLKRKLSIVLYQQVLKTHYLIYVFNISSQKISSSYK